MPQMFGPSMSLARKHIGGMVAVACAVSGGAALVTASAVLGETGLTSHLSPARLAETDIVVSARQRHPVVEDFDLPLTERVPVSADLVAAVAAVEGVAEASVYFDEPTETRFTGNAEGEADLITVTVEPGSSVEDVAAAVDSALPSDLEVTTGEAKGDVEALASGPKSELLAVVASLAGTLAVLVGFIVAGVLSVSVASQRRDLALLRAVGATPRQVRRMVAAQASVVAAVSLVPGVALGYLLADSFAGVLVESGLLPQGLPLALSPVSAMVTAALLLATVQLAARGAAWRASRMPATEAVRESRVEPRRPSRVRTRIGVVLLALAAAQAASPMILRSEAAFASAGSGTLVAAIGLAMSGPSLVRALTDRAARRLTDRTSPPLWLAVHNSRAYALRTAGSVTVLALVVGLTVMQVCSQATLSRATAAEAGAGAVADATVTAADSAGLTGGDLADLAAEDGIEAAVPLVSTTVLRPTGNREQAESHPTLALGPGAAAVIDPGVRSGDLSDLAGEAVAVSEAAASRWGLQVGRELPLILPDGSEASPEVVAVYERGFGFGHIISSVELLGGGGGERRFDAALVSGDADAVAAWTAQRPGVDSAPGATVLTAGSGVAADQWVNLLATAAMAGYVLLGVGNSLVASTARRRGEFAALRVAGATPRQIRAMVRREAAVMAVLAIGAGTAISVLPMSVLGLSLFGLPWPQGPLWLIPAIAAVAAGIAYVASMAPTRRALAVPPTAALGSAG